MDQRRPLVIIPAYEEELNLPEVLRELKMHCPLFDVVVIDDGSKDRSGEVAAGAGATVLTHPVNRGYGAALTSGYRYAVEHRYEVVVRMDADGQHDPAGIALLIDTLRAQSCDVVIGSRALATGGYRPSIPRRAGILAFGLLGGVLTGSRVTDPTSGFAAMNRRAASFLAHHTPKDYPDLNVRVALHRAGLRVIEAPASMRPRRAGQSMLSGIAPFLYVPRMLYYLAALYLKPPADE